MKMEFPQKPDTFQETWPGEFISFLLFIHRRGTEGTEQRF